MGNENEEVSAYTINAAKLERIEGKTITLSVRAEHSRDYHSVDYELHEDCEQRPRDLIHYLGEFVDIVLVNGKIFKIKSR